MEKKEEKKQVSGEKEPVAEAVAQNTKEPRAVETVPAKGGANEEMVHLIMFRLGSEYYAIKIGLVKEVTITPTITRMPRTPHFIKGVANIRGDIIAVMDLEQRFNIEPTPVEQGLHNPNVTYTLVLEAKDYNLGIIVREMPQSINLPVSKIDKTPSFLQDINIQENYIEGIAKVNNRLVIVLDMYKVLTQDEVNELIG
ncbi:chemotaxis protein CheW [Pontibacter harenae]|uniref:chemotaxis protein CheW n=1 Tax=Pontibacter harenae TaxID=2894083 RepID=UPI001E5BABAD|nr:chemotaxis protein CheW [Pontibacter harenae]MCC9165546.1 chemotaxis protein CheW [Pontibacter harenae]